MLDNVAHADLKVRTGYSAEFHDSVNMVRVFPTEFPLVQREYPILFKKEEGGDWQAVALLGLERGENLFLDSPAWYARYVPAIMQRGPFLIGLHQKGAGGSDGLEAMVHVDLDHPRISKTEGESVFLPHGGNSPYLERASRMLQVIYKGTEMAKPMFTAFEEAGLVESMELKINLDERTQYKLPDFHTINEERLARLDGKTLERLNRHGFLQLAVYVVNSLGNIEHLIDLKNLKRAARQA
jgi:hypothetical protein